MDDLADRYRVAMINLSNGFRVPSDKLSDFLLRANEKAYKNLAYFLDKYYVLDPKIISAKKENRLDLMQHWLYSVTSALETKMRQAADTYTDRFCVESGYVLCAHDDGYTYGWLYGDYVPFPDGIANYVEDYSYWENAERNHNVTAEAWRERALKWDMLLTSYHLNGAELIAPIISFAPFRYRTTNWVKNTLYLAKREELIDKLAAMDNTAEEQVKE